MSNQPKYANFGVRTIALHCDFLLYLLIMVFAISMTISSSNTLSELVRNFLIFTAAIYLPLSFAIPIYSAFTIHYFGMTIGKAVTGLRVVSESGQNLTLKRAFFRQTIGYMVSGAVFWLGYLSVIKNPKKQGWHDEMVGSVVLSKGKFWVFGVIFVIVLTLANAFLVGKTVNTFIQKEQIKKDFGSLVESLIIEWKTAENKYSDPDNKDGSGLNKSDKQESIRSI